MKNTRKKTKPKGIGLTKSSIGVCKVPSPSQKFVAHLDAAIAFHRTNHNDPHGTGNAVIASLVEVRNAYAKAFCVPNAVQATGGDGTGDEPPEEEEE